MSEGPPRLARFSFDFAQDVARSASQGSPLCQDCWHGGGDAVPSLEERAMLRHVLQERFSPLEVADLLRAPNQIPVSLLDGCMRSVGLVFRLEKLRAGQIGPAGKL